MSTSSRKGSPPSSSSKPTTRSPTQRLLKELSSLTSDPLPTGILVLSPLDASTSLFAWRAIISGAHLPPQTGYTQGRWLLSITIPPTYPNRPPEIRFENKICHPNIAWSTGEICLDVLKDNWRPVIGIKGAVESVVRLLAEPGVDSPLGIEVAALL
ncbi:hypothetical protein B7463_g9606, partial [Scytalidium lignicola]